MISIDQIATIADLCDFLDSAARVDAIAQPYSRNCYTLNLRQTFVKKADDATCQCGVDEKEEYFWNIDQVLCRLFDLDAFGWEFWDIRYSSMSAAYGNGILCYNITLRREV